MCHSRAIAVSPDSADSWNRQAAILLDLYRHPDAIRSAAHSLSLSPGHVDAFMNEGLGWLGVGNPTEALVRFEKALHLQPELAEAHYLSGVALQQLGRHEEAAPSFQQTLLKNRYHRFALGGLANAALQSCDWDLADTLKDRLNNVGSDHIVVPPLVMLGYFDHPALLQRAARVGCPAPKPEAGPRYESPISPAISANMPRPILRPGFSKAMTVLASRCMASPTVPMIKAPCAAGWPALLTGFSMCRSAATAM
jgi:tetratricopeptide (TPR) repeat protein